MWKPATFSDWLSGQPEEVQKDMLGENGWRTWKETGVISLVIREDREKGRELEMIPPPRELWTCHECGRHYPQPDRVTACFQQRVGSDGARLFCGECAGFQTPMTDEEIEAITKDAPVVPMTTEEIERIVTGKHAVTRSGWG